MPPTDRPTDLAALLKANQAFYDAFEARDIDAMSDLWEHSDRVVCTHPAYPMLRGWGAIAGSWYELFGGSEWLQFIVTNAHAEIMYSPNSTPSITYSGQWRPNVPSALNVRGPEFV